MRSLKSYYLIALLVCLAGCGGPQAAKPQNALESIEAVNLLAEKVSDALVELACTQFKAGVCTEPGKPLMPRDALRVQDDIDRAHAALNTLASIGAGQVGECLGKPRSQVACMAAVNALLIEADRYLMTKKGIK